MRTTDIQPVSWRQARRRIAAVEPLPAISVPLHGCVGAVLMEPLTAATDVPVIDCAADHGWAVSGQGPWSVITDTAARDLDVLLDRHAVPIRIGEPLPRGATAVLVRDRGVTDTVAERVRLQVADSQGYPTAQPGLIGYGQGIWPQGGEALAGSQLLAPGLVVTPATVALAAAVGKDQLTVVPPASVAVVLPQFGLARSGRLRPGRSRDVIAELLPTWIEAGPARLLAPVTCAATGSAISGAVEDTFADVVIVAGGVDPGVPSPVLDAVSLLCGKPLVPGLRLAPGGATALYELPSCRYLVTLPGRAPAAAVGLATVVDPLLASLSGRPSGADGVEAMLVGSLPADRSTIVLPGILERSELVLRVHPRPWGGPAGMHALAIADGLIVCEPGAKSETFVTLFPLPGVMVG